MVHVTVAVRDAMEQEQQTQTDATRAARMATEQETAQQEVNHSKYCHTQLLLLHCIHRRFISALLAGRCAAAVAASAALAVT